MDGTGTLMKRLSDTDIVGRLQEHVDKQEFTYDFIGDEWLKFHTQVFTNDYWLHTKFDLQKSCHVWWTKYFGVFRCVPEKCLKHCWKLCACHRGFDRERRQYRQLNLSEVMDIHELQQDMGVTSKVGMDPRDYTPTIWGAYWYTDSMDQGQKLFETLRGGLDKINPDIDLSLKRACTEYEIYLGPSNTWDDREFKWEETEKVLNKWVYPEPNHTNEDQHELIQQSVKLRFLHWAYMHGDMTYKDFIDGDDILHTFVEKVQKPITPSVTYNP
jgi:hypothetical protein